MGLNLIEEVSGWAILEAVENDGEGFPRPVPISGIVGLQGRVELWEEQSLGISLTNDPHILRIPAG